MTKKVGELWTGGVIAAEREEEGRRQECGDKRQECRNKRKGQEYRLLYKERGVFILMYRGCG